MLKKILLLGASAISAMALHVAELNLNEKELEVGTKFDIGQFNENVEPNTMFFGGKFFSPDASNSLEDNITSVREYEELNFLIIREIGENGFSLGLGGKVNHGKMIDKEFVSIPLGLEVNLVIPAPDLVPMKIHFDIYYSPQVLSLSNTKNYFEYRINYDIEFIKNVNVTIGYRNMNVSYDDTKLLNYNSSLYLGFKVGF